MDKKVRTPMPAAAAATVDGLQIRPERAVDADVVERLVGAAFGPGRFVKTAERLREGSGPLAALSFVAWNGDEAVGCVRLWPITIGAAPAILLGPFAVSDRYRSRGIGLALVETACQAAQAQGHAVVLLVGDEAYFSRNGFARVPRGQVTLPGPVDAGRVLWRGLKAGALDAVGGPVAPA